MMSIKSYFLLSGLVFASATLFSQPPCPGEAELSLIVEIYTDDYPGETAWSVTDSDGQVYAEVNFGTYEANTLYQRQVCIPDSSCMVFTLLDSYGDGIFSPGFYHLILEGDTLASGGPEFDDAVTLQFNCAPTQVCESALAVGEGQYTAFYDNSWYAFSPDSVGIYQISTCGLSTCDTKIWIYDTCEGITVAEDNQSTIFYSNDEGGCTPQAVVESFFEPEKTYYIRIGDHQDGCAEDIGWEIVYLGPVVGCTDPASCNYDPLATIDDGSCLPLGDPDCPDMPDLTVRQDILSSSIYLSTIESNDPCLIEEGCLQGYGQRDIIRFTTQIDNIGELDYFIGEPSTGNTQFTWDNCHNHFHYDGYAEYVLYTEEGVELPVGFKNGFCVIDLGCTTGSPQYGCGNMGITAGCFDIYSSELECQWIDVTDVPDGRYTFVTRVNWDFAPDKLGRLERDSMNNWAQVCILLDRSSGQLEMSLDDNCDPYVDCMGVLYGDAEVDCTGTCGGGKLRGDLDANGTQEIFDAQQYVSGVLGEDLTATACIDLNADDTISVYDAALLASCINYGDSHPHEGSGTHDHCSFPAGVVNTNDTLTFSIIGADFDEQYIDIGVQNPTTGINAYQFKVEGLFITTVENLAPESQFPISPLGANNRVVGISYQDSILRKSSAVQPLCRIYYAELTDDFVCLTAVEDVVNQDHEQAIGLVTDACVEAMPNRTNEAANELACRLFPNPFSQTARLVFSNPLGEAFQLDILTADGRLLKNYSNLRGQEVEIDARGWAAGLYWYRLRGKRGTFTGRMLVGR